MNKFKGIFIPVLVICLWELLVRVEFFPPALSAAPTSIFIKLLKLTEDGTILRHSFFSLIRIIGGVAIGSLIGILVGLVLSQIKKIDNYFSPFLTFLAPIPIVVWIPFAIMFFGTSELFKISLSALVAFFIIYLNIYQTLKTIDWQYIELSMIYEKSSYRKFKDILLPYALPSILTSLRLTVALSWVIIFFVEYGTAERGSEGLGWFISDARAIGRIDDQFAGVIVLAILGFVADRLLSNFQKSMIAWKNIQYDQSSVRPFLWR